MGGRIWNPPLRARGLFRQKDLGLDAELGEPFVVGAAEVVLVVGVAVDDEGAAFFADVFSEVGGGVGGGAVAAGDGARVDLKGNAEGQEGIDAPLCGGNVAGVLLVKEAVSLVVLGDEVKMPHHGGAENADL